jgi:MYXO-CTERM domain-containing protein
VGRGGKLGVMRALLGVLAVSALLLLGGAAPAAADGGDAGFTITDPRITESSGLAASHRHKGVYWTHNDQDSCSCIYAVDGSTGRTVARVTLSGVGTQRDVEAIQVGPNNEIWVGDIGDNDGVTWPHVWIYRLPEPEVLKDQTIRATQYTVRYSDGSRDAESMVVHPRTGRVYIIDKHEEGGHLYAGPEELSPTGVNVFKPVAPVDLWATDAAFSPDGKILVVRGYFGGVWYEWNDGDLKRGGRIGVPLGQGESVTYTADGSKILLGMEGANSEVVARDAPGPGSSSSGSGAATGSSASGGDGSGGTEVKVGALAVAAVAVVLLGARRLTRRK